MTPDQHARAKELFFKARELSPDEREQFLRQECADDGVVRHEVTSLLRHDDPRTLLPSTSRPVVEAGGFPRHGLIRRVERAATTLLQQLFRNGGTRLTVLATCLLMVIGLGYWTHAGMKSATRSIAASQLETILNADVTALELWIEEKKKDVKLFSARPEIKRAVAELARIAETTPAPADELRQATALGDLRQMLDRFDRIVGRPEQDAIIMQDGLILADDQDENVGRRLNTEGITALVPVFQGQTLFLKPHPNGAFVNEPVADLDTPMVYVVAPVYQGELEASKIIAAAGFGFPADGEFSEILSVARPGSTGETYTFDEKGLLLSESQFDDQLRERGLLPKALDKRSIFRIEIRDPGYPSRSQRSSIEAAAQPLTRLAALAIAAGRKGSDTKRKGVILDPYVNYRGARVIGAWQWLSKYSMGIATEVEQREQYAPMKFPVIAEWIRFGILTTCIVTLLGAASWIAFLGHDVEQARQLGQYTLQEKIGEGGMGVVYRARHALLQRDTAIKLLRPEIVDDASLARFEREVQLASSLTHPNTIDIFDFGRTPEGAFYCVMEFLDGRTLHDLVRSEGPLSAARAVRILRQIAGSLNEAHQSGLIHRDIKPSNIMQCVQGGIRDFVKVLDFGLARSVEQSQDSDVTGLGIVMGTPSYLPPERFTDPSTIDQRSDVYSFGAVGYFLLTGRRIFETTQPGDLLRQILEASPGRPSEVTDNIIPPELEELICRCLASRLDDRPNSMQQVLAEIEQIMQHE